jgi:ferredoxin/flavodoxin
MIGLYFSGTCNTKYCVEKFVSSFDEKNKVVSIEESDFAEKLAGETDIVFGYPVYFSNVPKIVRDFIVLHKYFFRGKKIFIIATMGLFSGDGTGCSARILRKCGAEIIGGLHLLMPDCISDNKLLKKTPEEDINIIRRADAKIAAATMRFRDKNPTKDGLSFVSRLAGLFGQRLYFYYETLSYKNKPNINQEKCSKCGSCVGLCPMKNLKMISGALTHEKRCAMCYRCVNSCPKQALTVLGKRVVKQKLIAVSSSQELDT